MEYAHSDNSSSIFDDVHIHNKNATNVQIVSRISRDMAVDPDKKNLRRRASSNGKDLFRNP
jgi:hypothetical protein